MFIKNKLKNNKGFSLVEMIVYLAIMTIITTTLVQSFIVVLKSNKNSFVDSVIRNSGYSIMENIIREARKSNDINTCSSNLLSFVQANNNIVNFSVSNGVVDFSEGISTQVSKGPLNNSDIRVTSLNCNIINTENSKAIKFKIDLSTTIDGQYKTESFYSTVILRGSY